MNKIYYKDIPYKVGGDSTLVEATITERGETSASDFRADGFSKVNVNVPYTDVHYAKDDIVSLEGEDFPLKSLTADITAIQDLHGYDSPWAGGAGKNKLPINSLSISGGGITAVIDRDSNNNVVSVTVNGTASGVVYVILNTFTLPSGTYTISGCPSNGGTDSYRLYDDKHTSWADNGSGASFTLNEASQVAPTIRIANGYTVNNLKFYPMIESGSSKTSFAPYSNICPISGHTEANVSDTSKNLVNWKWNTFNEGKLEIFLKGGTYTLSAEAPLANGNAYIRGIKLNGEYCTKQELRLNDWSDSSTSGVYYGSGGQQTYTFSVPNSGAVIEFGKLNNNGTISAQLEVGSTATTYEPYNGNTYTIDLDGTRYGGELRIINGVAEFVADRKYLTIDDFNSASAGTSAGGLHWFDANYKPKGKLGNKNICSICAYVQNGWASTITVMSVGISATIPVRIYDSSESLSDFKNKYPNIQVVYELATPTIIPLGEVAISSLDGSNNIWADCGKINKAVYIRDLNIVINNLLNA